MDETSPTFIQDARRWAEQQWQHVQLGDKRLTKRAVQVGAALAAQPAASLAQQMGSWPRVKGAYNLLKHRAVSHQRLSEPHWQATRLQTAAYPVVLLVQDVTQLDYSRYAKTMEGLGPIGDGRGRGLLLHTTLAVVPQPRHVLGVAHQQSFLRQPLPAGQERRRRPKAARESRVWGEAVRAVGPTPRDTRWVVVADRAADNTDLLLTCRSADLDFTIRLAYDHRLVSAQGEALYLRATVRQWAAVVGRMVQIPARGGRAAREAHLHLSFGVVQVRTPAPQPPLQLWVVRAWEVAPPPTVEPIEWIVGTSLPITTAAAALEQLDWYSARWLVEEYHQCLKSGCAVERRDLGQARRIQALLGFLALIAVRLLQLREDARHTPDLPATAVVEPLRVQLVARQLELPMSRMTVRTFWRGVAQLGGFLNRRRDQEPGWQTLWRGWLYLDTLVQGVRLAASLPDP